MKILRYVIPVILLFTYAFSDSTSVSEGDSRFVDPGQFKILKNKETEKEFWENLEKERRAGNEFRIQDSTLIFKFGYSVMACLEHVVESEKINDTLHLKHKVNRRTCQKHIQDYFAEGRINWFNANKIVVKVDFYDSEKFERNIEIYTVPKKTIKKLK